MDKLGMYCIIFTCTNTYLCMRADLHAHLFLLSFSFYGWVGRSYIEGSVWEVPIHMLHRIFMNNMFFQIEAPFDKYFLSWVLQIIRCLRVLSLLVMRVVVSYTGEAGGEGAFLLVLPLCLCETGTSLMVLLFVLLNSQHAHSTWFPFKRKVI